MSAYTPSQIETMARTFTTKQSEALSALELPARVDGEIFEFLLDQCADNMHLREAAWDLFASTCRLQFFGADASKADRERWFALADVARADLHAEWVADQALQAADHYHDMRRDEAAA